MGLFSGFLLGVFYVGLFGVSFVCYSMGYCLFLLVGALSFCGFVYLEVGLNWYLLLFCLVYVGGVYILLVYVSMYEPNFFVWLSYSYGVMLSVFFFFSLMWCSLLVLNLVCLCEWGHYLCLLEGGFSYCFFCVVLLVGFCLVSLVSGGKDSFSR